MNISQIYSQYQILPSLQLHMLRVAAVAKTICEEINIEIDTHNVISACLLHDMGNILKFNMDLFPEFFEPEGKRYWQNVKNKYIKKYGEDEHEATVITVKEIGVGTRVLELVNSFQFSIADKNLESSDYGKKICAYSDMRVEPKSVVSLYERLEEGKKRFYQNKPGTYDVVFFQNMAKSLVQIEKDIFLNTLISPKDINDDAIDKIIVSLRTFEVIK